MIFVRLYLLAGLIAHKLVWELLKRRQASGGEAAVRAVSAFQRLLKMIKTAILAGIVAQTLLPEILPVLAEPRRLRIIGVLTYTLGLAVAVLGRGQLGANWSDIEAPQIRRQQTVVATGVYRYIRHPIYAGDLLLLFGFELTLNSWLVLGVAVMVPYVVQQAVREEQMLTSTLTGYEEYCAHTKRFVPFLV